VSAVREQVRRIERYVARHGRFPPRWYVGQIELDEILAELEPMLIKGAIRKVNGATTLMGVPLVVRADF
jgi:hypothetical protein